MLIIMMRDTTVKKKPQFTQACLPRKREPQKARSTSASRTSPKERQAGCIAENAPFQQETNLGSKASSSRPFALRIVISFLSPGAPAHEIDHLRVEYHRECLLLSPSSSSLSEDVVRWRVPQLSPLRMLTVQATGPMNKHMSSPQPARQVRQPWHYGLHSDPRQNDIGHPFFPSNVTVIKYLGTRRYCFGTDPARSTHACGSLPHCPSSGMMSARASADAAGLPLMDWPSSFAHDIEEHAPQICRCGLLYAARRDLCPAL